MVEKPVIRINKPIWYEEDLLEEERAYLRMIRKDIEKRKEDGGIWN